MNATKEETSGNKRVIFFNNTISWDGISFMVGIITCSVWVGALANTVRNHTELLKHQSEIQEIQSRTMETLSQSVAVLTTLVNERTQKK